MIASLLADTIIIVAGMLVILAIVLAVLRTNRKDAKDVWEAPEATVDALPPSVSPATGYQDWEVLEDAVTKIAASALEAGRVVDEASEALGSAHSLATRAGVVREEVLEVKAELERQLEKLEKLDCLTCGQPVHWVSGLGTDVGRWVHAEPGPHSDSVLRPVSHRADVAP